MPRKRHTDIAETPASGPVLPDRVQANNPADTDEQLATEVEELRRQVVELHELKDEDQRAIRDWEWLARLVDENPDPVLRVSLHGAILYRNPAAVPLCRQWNPDDELIVPEAIRKLVFAAYGGAKVIHREMAFGEHTYLVTVAPAPAKYINIYARTSPAANRRRRPCEKGSRSWRASMRRAVTYSKVCPLMSFAGARSSTWFTPCSSRRLLCR
jgi:hypothetical protein